MSQIVLATLLTLALFVGNSIGAASPYFWRTYNGTVPSDAVIAGADSRGNVYIAKAFLPGYGIYVGQLFDGQTSVTIPIDTLANNLQTSSTIDVLCSNDNNKPVWYAANTNITPALINGTTLIEPVIGGRTSYYNLNYVYIGKLISATGYSFAGSVHTDYYFYYVDSSGVGHYSTSYELLVVEDVSGSLYNNTELKFTTFEEPKVDPKKIAMKVSP